MFRVFKQARNRCDEDPHQDEKQGRSKKNRDQRGAEYPFRLFITFGIPEKGCFHAIQEQYKEKSDVGIQLGHDPVFLLEEQPGIDGNKQVIQQAGNNGPHSVNGCLPGELF